MVTIQKIIDFVFLPFLNLPPFYGLAFVAFLVTFFALVIYKYASNQRAIKRTKEKIKAHFVEFWIFRDDPLLILKAQAGILFNSFKYFIHALIPLVIMFPLVLLLFINCELRYHYRPFLPGETLLLKLKVSDEMWDNSQFQIHPSSGLTLTAPPLKFKERDESGEQYLEIDYRLQVNQVGRHFVQIFINNSKSLTFEIIADHLPGRRVTPLVSKNFFSNLWYSGNNLLKSENQIQEIKVNYPKASVNFFGWKAHWVLPFLILIFIFAFILKPILKVVF